MLHNFVTCKQMTISSSRGVHHHLINCYGIKYSFPAIRPALEFPKRVVTQAPKMGDYNRLAKGWLRRVAYCPSGQACPTQSTIMTSPCSGHHTCNNGLKRNPCCHHENVSTAETMTCRTGWCKNHLMSYSECGDHTDLY